MKLFAALLLFIVPFYANAAVSFDASSTAGNPGVSTVTRNHTTTGNDRLLIVAITNGSNRTVSYVLAAGYSIQPRNYVFTDSKPFPGVSYYCLKQTNNNGDVYYSQVVGIRLYVLEIVQVYPNPAEDHLGILLSAAHTTSVSVEMFSADGKLVYYIASHELEEGVNYLSLPLEGCAAGYYTVRVKTEDLGEYTQKQFIVR